MEIQHIILICILTSFIALGMILIYNAREIVTQYFSTQNKNVVVKILKVVGSMISIVSALVILCI